MEAFLLRALLAAIGLAIVAAPFGCLIVWNRMAYFGETIAQAGLIGIAIALAFSLNLTFGIALTAVMMALIVLLLTRQQLVPMDSVLGLTHYAALSLGIIAAAAVSGPSLDLRAYLFGDLFAVSHTDLYVIYLGGGAVLAVMAWIWEPLVRSTIHGELAEAEGIPVRLYRAAFIILLALTIAVTVKIVGILLVIAFMIVPAVAARVLAASPFGSVLIAAAVGVASVITGLWGAWTWDAPGGPSIVLGMSVFAAALLVTASLTRARQ